MAEYVVEMRDIVKDFPGLRANDHITLQLKKGEVHALLGENGAGKSTLMSILFGLYRADEGQILVKGKEVQITNPNVANELDVYKRQMLSLVATSAEGKETPCRSMLRVSS